MFTSLVFGNDEPKYPFFLYRPLKINGCISKFRIDSRRPLRKNEMRPNKCLLIRYYLIS